MDARTLFFELEGEIKEINRKGIHVEFADIIESTDNDLTLILDNTSYRTGFEKPNTYFLNHIQKFKRIE